MSATHSPIAGDAVPDGRDEDERPVVHAAEAGLEEVHQRQAEQAQLEAIDFHGVDLDGAQPSRAAPREVAWTRGPAA